jgi:hypothetical protein
MTSCSLRLLALRLVDQDLTGIRGSSGRSWACAGVSAQVRSQNARFRMSRRDASFEKESPRGFPPGVHLPLAARTAFVVRTGPRFRLIASVDIVPLMTAYANVHNSPIQQLSVSAWMFTTCGSAGSGDDSQVCAEMSKQFETQDRALGGGSTMELHTRDG